MRKHTPSILLAIFGTVATISTLAAYVLAKENKEYSADLKGTVRMNGYYKRKVDYALTLLPTDQRNLFENSFDWFEQVAKLERELEQARTFGQVRSIVSSLRTLGVTVDEINAIVDNLS